MVQSYGLRFSRRSLHLLVLGKRRLLEQARTMSSTDNDSPWRGMSDTTRALANDLLQEASEADPWKRRRALSKAITLVENTAPDHQEQASLLLTHLLLQRKGPGRSFRVGIAGNPGAGKSTFIESLGQYILNQTPLSTAESSNDIWFPPRLAVLCVDPSSSLTGGAILGDKTRMTELSRDPRAFVRPTPTRASLGGIAPNTEDALRLVEAMDYYPLLLVETVGLGQSEIEVTKSVDMLVLLVPPAAGDALQGIKKGIVEVADLIVVTKADGDLLSSAKVTEAEYKRAMPFMAGQFLRSHRHGPTPVLLASSVSGHGLGAVWEHISQFRREVMEQQVYQANRQEQNHYWMWKNLRLLVEEETQRNPALQSQAKDFMRQLDKGSIPPRVAAAMLLRTLKDSSKT
jgi:LAO/AO transport system kinase